ncbi:MAG: phenylalanine--tRNA ligase subunit beta [Candidatus Anstonellales archaeon]
MAVVRVGIEEIKGMTGLSKEEIINGLNEIGAPSSEVEGRMLDVEVTPNRPDLLSVEGLARALSYYYEKEGLRKYTAEKKENFVIVDKSVKDVRPYVVMAKVVDVKPSEEVFLSLIQLQEKLHDTLGRKRKKVAIGIHDADRVVFPIVYKTVEDIVFVPLEFDKKMSAKQILEEHPKGKMYAHLVKEKKYPMLIDQEGVISFPPIINSERTKLTPETRNFVVDVTGTHADAVSQALNIIVCALADRGGRIEQTNVNGEWYPKLEENRIKIKRTFINNVLGSSFSEEEIKKLLKKAGIGYEHGVAFIPPYRIDVLDQVDIVEDVAIAYGYNRFKPEPPELYNEGYGEERNGWVVELMVGFGFNEVKTFYLTNNAELEKISPGWVAKKTVKNPASLDYTVLKPTCLVSFLKIISENKTAGMPQKIFEIGRVYKDGEEKEVLAAAITDDRVGINNILPILFSFKEEGGFSFELRSEDVDGFIHGRAAKIVRNGVGVGYVGEVHPDVLVSFGIETPVVFFEIEL